MTPATLTGEVHEVTSITVDGSECWIASILENGRFNPRDRRNVQECATEAEARRWAADEMRRRA